MSYYFEKSVEFAELILRSDESIYLADARAVYNEDKESVEKMAKYEKYQNEIKDKIKDGKYSQEEIKELTKKSEIMAIELKQDPIIAALILAESEFNVFVNNCMNVVKNTIMGKNEDKGSGCHGSCSANCGK